MNPIQTHADHPTQAAPQRRACVEVAELACAGGPTGGVLGGLVGERWLIVGVGGQEVWLFGRADGGLFCSAAEAGGALGGLTKQRPEARFVALPVLLLAAVAGGGGARAGCGGGER